MGSLDTKSDPRIQEQKHETGNNNSSPPIDSSTTSDKNNLLELTSASDTEDNDKKISPSPSPSSTISSIESKLEDPIQDSDSKNGEKVNEEIDHTPKTPPIQVMERQTTPKYQIPSSVFARKQSKSQDWGMASNESLFSIQMSFNYQDSIEKYLQENDETGKTHGSETGQTHGSKTEDEHVNSKSQENEERNGCVSVESESAKSFTFPVLTGDTDKGGSLEAISECEQAQSQAQSKPKEDKAASSWTNCFGCCTFCS